MSYAKEANRILEDYRNQSKKELDMRFEEVFRNVPEYQDLLQHRNELGYEYLKKSIGGDKEELKNLEIINSVVNYIQSKYDEKLTVLVEKLENFVLAEDYHQDYLDKNPGGYCHINLNAFDEDLDTTE